MTNETEQNKIKKLLEDSKEWYGYIPKGFIQNKLQDFFKELKE